MGTVIDITQYKLDRALKNEEVDAKLKLRNQSHANLIQHVKNVPYMTARGPKIASSKINLPEEQKEFNVSPKQYIQLVTGSDKPINVKEEKLENIRRHSEELSSLVVEKQEIGQAQIVDLVQPPVVEEVNDVQPAIAQNDSQVVATSVVDSVSGDKVFDITEYADKLNNETQLLKKITEEVALAQQAVAAKDEEVNKLSIEVSELDKKEEDIKKREEDIKKSHIEVDQELAAAYEEQCRIQVLKREEQKSLLEELMKREQAADSKIIQFNSRKNDSEKRIFERSEIIAREEERLARKKELLAAILPQNNFSDNIVQDNVIQFPVMEEESEEKVKRRVA